MDLEQVRKELKEIELRVRKLEIELNNVPDLVERHEDRLKGLEIFKAQVLVLAAMGSIVGGIVSSALQHYFIR